MAVAKVKVSESHERLMLRLHTTHSPMSIDGIVGVLAFCAGAAIVRGGDGRVNRRQLREMAVANIDFGMEAMRSSVANTSLILPEGLQ